MSSTQPTATDKIQRLAAHTNKHKRILYAVGFLIILGACGVFFFEHYQRQRNNLAQNDMFQAVYYFEQGDFNKALHGDDIYPGLLEIATTYRFTKATNLAHLYIGVSYLHQQVYDKAIQHLAKTRFKDWLLQARVWSLIGDAYVEQKNYSIAKDYYLKAAAYKPNKAFTPNYLIKAALACEADRNLYAAQSYYQRIVQEFPDTPQYGTAVKHVARLEILNKRS